MSPRGARRRRLVIYGAGGHGRVVLDAALAGGSFDVRGFVDDDAGRRGTRIHGVPVAGSLAELVRSRKDGWLLVVAVGEPAARREIVERLSGEDARYGCVVHPSAVIGLGAEVGAGSVVLAGAVVHTDARVGRHVIVNTAASIDHDVRVGDFTHIAPGAHVGGDVTIGQEALIGIGASVIPGVFIGDRAIVGAGAVVIDDVPDRAVVVGVPARPIGNGRDHGG
jgi:acetyltransferase EpsM